eukprot:scaffold12256_cov83-Skeletonema_dohrnii-CCMP3373.AAC.1
MKRRQRRNLLERKYSEEDQRRLSGRIYLNRAADTKLRKMRWKLRERINRLKAKLAKMQAKCRQQQRQSVSSALGGEYREAYQEAFQFSPVIFDWSPTLNPYEWWSPRAEETYTSESYVDPTNDVYDELADERGGKPYLKHNSEDLAALVANLDGPTKLVANFVATSLKEHAKNIEAAVLRAEIMFNESKSDKFRLRDSSSSYMQKYRSTPCVVDTGASYGLTPFKEDFLTYEECNIKVKAVGSENVVIGMGIVLYKMVATNGDTCFVPGIAYHMPECSIRLLSPQAYHQSYAGHSEVTGENYTFFLAQAANGPRKHIIQVPISSGSNLPMIYNVSTTAVEKRNARPYFVQSIKMHQHFCRTFFGKWRTTYCMEGENDESTYEFGSFLHVNNCVTHDCNPNLSAAQKELLLWHYRLQCSLKHVQYLMSSHTRKDAEGNETTTGAVIQPKNPAAATCDANLKCAACELARANATKPKTGTKTRDKSKDKSLTKEKYEPGDYVSMDTVPVGIPGRAYEGYGGPNAGVVFTHLTLFHDAATGIIKIYLQQNGTAAATLYSKEQFEKFMWHEAGVVVKHYHSDQGSNFTDAKFEADCDEKNQTQSFSGTGAKFANGAAERAVQTLFWRARHMMLHCALRWDLEG